MNKRKLKKGFKFCLFILIIISLTFLSYKVFKKIIANDSSPAINLTDKKNEIKETWPKTYNVSLLAAGDTILHNDINTYAKQSDGSYDYHGYFSEIKDIVKKYDITYYNQETLIGDDSIAYSSYPTFYGPSTFGDAMIDTGFNTVSLATNHSFDKYEKGVLATLKYWKTKNALTSGLSESEKESTNYKIMTKNNITYGFLSYTYSTNGITVPENKSYLVNVYSDELAKKDIEAIRSKVDVLIVAMHWGNEYSINASSTQKTQAEYLSSLGVDIIIGNHAHVLEPVEWINNTLVIYALGNLISNQGILSYSSYGYGGAIKGTIGAFATLEITKLVNEDGSSKIKLNDLNIELLYTYKNTQNRYYKVIPFSKINTSYLSNYKEVYENYKQIIQKYDNSINVKPYADA